MDTPLSQEDQKSSCGPEMLQILEAMKNEIKNEVKEEMEDELQQYLERMDKIYATRTDLEKMRDNLDLIQTQFEIDDEKPIPSVSTVRTSISRSTSRKNPATNEQLEQDFFSMMMQSHVISRAWLVGLFVFSIQIILGSLLIHDEVARKTLGSTMSIPIKTKNNLRVTQAMAILLSVMTQTDLLMGFRQILILPRKSRNCWGKSCGLAERDCNNGVWIQRVLIPNFLKMIQGALILVASFFVIIQSRTSVDVLKDYSALFVVSSVDDLFFAMADSGYFGAKLSQKADEVKKTKLEKEDKSIATELMAALFCIMISLFSGWVYITVGQVNGRYVKQKYPLCQVENTYDTEKGTTFLSIIGDNVCQFKKGQGTNIADCGWDGGDCVEFNDRYPTCSVSEFSLLGDGKCDHGLYNTFGCGYDNGDCLIKNVKIEEEWEFCQFDTKYKNLTFLSLLNDNSCQFMLGQGTNIPFCGFDGGDCLELNEKYPNCTVPEVSRLADGICDGGLYNTEDCGFDMGDCLEKNNIIKNLFPNCAVEDLSLLSNGVCNGGEYSSAECGLDGGDCTGCNVDDVFLIGDGFCDGGNYDEKECSFDGFDCTPPMALIGDIYDGERKWTDAVLGVDGSVYAIPNDASKILKFDTVTNSTSLVGKDLDIGTGLKWFGGVVGMDGCIYGIPYNANSILRYDPISMETTLVAEGHEILESEMKFVGGVVVSNGCIYLIPFNCKTVVKFDPSKLDDPLSEVGDDFGNAFGLYWGGVLGQDGNVYSIPFQASRVLKINVTDDTTSFIGGEYVSDGKWRNGVLGKDGNIYACPYFSNKILQINTSDQSTRFVGPDLGGDFRKWAGLVNGPDDHLYGIPTNSNFLLRFEPVLEKSTLIPLEGRIETTVEENRWGLGVLSNNGMIYAAPFYEEQVLAISPISFRSTNKKNCILCEDGGSKMNNIFGN